MVAKLEIEKLVSNKRLTLNAPRLQNVKLLYCRCGLKVNIVYDESIKKLIASGMKYLEESNASLLDY